MTEFTERTIAGYGWLPDLPDARDHLYSAPRLALAALPSSMDLRSGCPPVYDQQRIGSCTANAIGGAFEFEVRKQGLPDFMPSRLFIYYNERKKERSIAHDAGAMIRDGVKSVAKLGVCSEALWPYDGTQANPDGTWPAGDPAGEQPTAECYTEALKNRATTYQKVSQTLDQMKGCLASGFPFVFGFTVYDSFESQAVAKSGVVPMPDPQTEKVLGGHAVMAVGYDDADSRFVVRNSWGDGWGQAGYFTMPYQYLSDASLASDFWTLRIVT